MKTLKLALIIFIIPAAALFMNGCILDAFNELTQNLSIERTFSVNGNTNSAVNQSATFRLADSKVYTDNRDKIKKMRYKAAAFCVSKNTVPSLQGTIILTLKTSTGVPLFTKTLPNFKPSDYLGIAAKDLELTAAEVNAIDLYLANVDLLDTISFTAGLQFQNVTPANTQVSMDCFVSLALEMTIKP
ncbi:MAG TPA: hypothetical protein VK470_19050 [Bacteroidota bacterium]|nr:hypothetical protein [Bacteroidota bacterium]